MCEVILEIEQIYSLFGPKDEKMFVHDCNRFIMTMKQECGKEKWRMFEKRYKKRRNKEQIKVAEKSLNDKLVGVEGNIMAVKK
jgi:hypothetical protein